MISNKSHKRWDQICPKRSSQITWAFHNPLVEGCRAPEEGSGITLAVPRPALGLHKAQRLHQHQTYTTQLHQTRMNNLQTWVTGTIQAGVRLTDILNKRALAKLAVEKPLEEIHSWRWTHPSKSRTNCWLTSSDSADQISKDEQWQ